MVENLIIYLIRMKQTSLKCGVKCYDVASVSDGLHSVQELGAASCRKSGESVYVISLTANRVFTSVKIAAEVTLKLERSHCVPLFPLTQP